MHIWKPSREAFNKTGIPITASHGVRLRMLFRNFMHILQKEMLSNI